MSRAIFSGHEPTRDDGLRQIARAPLAPDEQAQVDRFRQDIERHKAKRNRFDIERRVQVELYRGRVQ